MEPFKQQRQLLGGNGIAHVPHRDPGLSVHHGHAQIQRGALPGELGGIFQQIVEHLRDHVIIAQHQNRLIRNIGLYVQMPVIDLLFHGDQHPAHGFADVKVVAVPQRVHGLKLADIQHPPHQPAQSAALICDDL